VIASVRDRRQELGRTEEAAVLDAVERGVGQEVERPDTREVDGVMFERLALEVAGIDPDRFGAELEEQPAEPGLEDGGALVGVRRPARVRSTGDVEDAFSACAIDRAERAPRPIDELLEDPPDLGLARDLPREVVPAVECRCGPGERVALGRRAPE